MGEPIRIARGILIPESAIEWHAVRSSGPGGQNVNKVASKIDLRVDLSAVTDLAAPRARPARRASAASRKDAEGKLVMTSQRTRDQARNLEDARDKVKKLVERALREPRPRRVHPTEPGGHRPPDPTEARAKRHQAGASGRRHRRRVARAGAWASNSGYPRSNSSLPGVQ